MTRRKAYLDAVLGQVPRLLAQLDRNPISPTYGCFDWIFWHDRVSGFPNGHAQEGMLVLTYLFDLNDEGNPYAGSVAMRDWAIASLRYWARIQHTDGTIDEFYVNERQLGATAIVLCAVAKTFSAFRDSMSEQDMDDVVVAIRRSADFLASHDETHLLSNHQAQAVLALFLSGRILSIDYSRAIAKRLERIRKGQSGDGWYAEYGGADPGYLSTTIAFLAEYMLESGDMRMDKGIRKAMAFASNFLYPDGTYGGIMGSRNTSHLWLSGFEVMMGMDSRLEYGAFCGFAAASKELLTPEKEDRYFHEQLYDFLMAWKHCAEGGSGSLVWARAFTRSFPDSGISLSCRDSRYVVVNLRKGGIIRVYSVESGRCIFSDAGIALVGRSVMVTSVIDRDSSVSTKGSILSVSGRLVHYSPKGSSVMKGAALSVGMLALGRTSKVSNFIKDRLIGLLISGGRRSDMRYERSIDLAKGTVKDIISGKGLFHRIIALTDLKAAFVAYSKSFCPAELHRPVEYDGKRLSRTGRWQAIRKMW
jgi:hypothetical protein